VPLKDGKPRVAVKKDRDDLNVTNEKSEDMVM
jgi:hypothetical protein